MAKIIFLGTASSVPTKKRDNTSFLFIRKKTTFLIDCPGAIVQKLLKVGVDFRKLKNIIITHQHPDHIYGIISLIHTQYCLNDNLNIFSNIHCIKIIKRLVKIFRLDKKEYPKIKYIDVFKTNFFYCRYGLKMRAIKNKHTKDSLGIKFSFEKKSLFYSSDTSFSLKTLQEAGRLNYLIHDCTASSSYFRKHPSLYKMHTSASSLSQHLKNTPGTKLIPIHFLLLGKAEEKRIKKELDPLKKRLILVRDFQTVRVWKSRLKE